MSVSRDEPTVTETNKSHQKVHPNVRQNLCHTVSLWYLWHKPHFRQNSPFLSPAKKGPFWRKRRKWRICILPTETRASLLKPPKTTKMTKIAVSLRQRHGLEKAGFALPWTFSVPPPPKKKSANLEGIVWHMSWVPSTLGWIWETCAARVPWAQPSSSLQKTWCYSGWRKREVGFRGGGSLVLTVLTGLAVLEHLILLLLVLQNRGQRGNRGSFGGYGGVNSHGGFSHDGYPPQTQPPSLSFLSLFFFSAGVFPFLLWRGIPRFFERFSLLSQDV